MAMHFLEIEFLNLGTPTPAEVRKGVKPKVISKETRGINLDMVVSIGPGKEVELEGEQIETTEIEMINEVFYCVPGNYRSFIDRIVHHRV